jgi:hypothetical protein
MSFVTRLTTETGSTENPTWEDVEGAILALDADTRTEVMLAPTAPQGPPEGDHHMGIGGGKDGMCIVYMTEDNLQFWNLEDPSKGEETRRVRMLIGGQEGEYRQAQCVPREWALRAAREYVESGRRTADLTWVRG